MPLRKLDMINLLSSETLYPITLFRDVSLTPGSVPVLALCLSLIVGQFECRSETEDVMATSGD
jgi:hypothetical protein